MTTARAAQRVRRRGRRLRPTSVGTLLFVYKRALQAAASTMKAAGYRMHLLPGPYAPAAQVELAMRTIRDALDAGGTA
jgi:hypothetical protein